MSRRDLYDGPQVVIQDAGEESPGSVYALAGAALSAADAWEAPMRLAGWRVEGMPKSNIRGQVAWGEA